MTVVSPQASVTAALDDEGSQVRARATVDVVSAASVDVVSHATGAFHETRTAGELGAALRVGAWRPELRLATSIEPDYQSYGAGAGVERRLGSPDTTLRVGWDTLHDRVGRAGTSWDDWSRTLWTHVLDVSLTQNLDARTVLRGTYTLTVQDGYQAKPYRYVPLFDQAGVDAAAAAGDTLDLDTFDRYRLSERPPEEVPGLRVRHALAVRALRWLPSIEASVRGDYRFYVDSWSMQAHTLELALVRPFGDAVRVSVQNRAHFQTSASFWQRTYVVDPGEIPRYRSLDRDLSRAFIDTASVRVDVGAAEAAWHAYVDVGGQYSRFDEFLLLDARSALLVQVGVRFRP